MQASRVVVSQDKTTYKPLTKKQKTKLKKEAVKAYIQSRPFMSRIKLEEFQNVLHTSNPSAYQFVQGMVKRKEIIRHSLSPKTFAYTIPGEIRVTKPAFPTLVKPETDEPTGAEGLAEAVKQDAKEQEDARHWNRASTPVRSNTVRRLAERYFVESFGDRNFERFVEWCDKQ